MSGYSEKISLFQPRGGAKLFALLKSFGINCDSIDMESKKFFDVYDLKLSRGVRSSKIERVLVDIGISMSALSKPIGYPVLKDGIYRIEIQTREFESPSLMSVCDSFPSNYYAPIAIGMDDSGEYFHADLNSIPNLLIGGVPGAGKSMLLHSMIISLIKSGVELYLIDPKMVEFVSYEGARNVRGIYNSVEETEAAIECLRQEMESRFKLLRKSSTRNVIEYNKKKKSKLRPIVLVIDEWADIVLQSSGIHKLLCSVAQKGRAAGISIILATQRPSAKVISGLVKANFPGRIALQVASATDSRIILDCKGAEDLVEVGTGLYLDGRSAKPKMFRAPFLRDIDEELEAFSIETNKKDSFWRRILFNGL